MFLKIEAFACPLSSNTLDGPRGAIFDQPVLKHKIGVVPQVFFYAGFISLVVANMEIGCFSAAAEHSPMDQGLLLLTNSKFLPT
ncbi:hypothetical protein F5Y14DRAFT_452783 [Nemania sp. NC0429]|nr:hypothetical protein F5Y14DRAFT_452783 [Nemania sp. NC0429]